MRGTGTVTGALQTAAGATVSPGSSEGVLNTGDVSFNGGALTVEIGGTATGSYDQVNVTGAVTLNADTTLTLASVSGYVPAVGHVFTIVNNDGGDAVTGSGRFVVNGTPINNGEFIQNFLGSALRAQLSYTNGNDITLTVQAASDLNISTSSFNENISSGTQVANLSVSNPVGTYSFSLTNGAGSTDNASFTISPTGVLVTATAVNFEAKSSYSIRVKADNGAGSVIEKSFVLSVNDLAEVSNIVVGSGTQRASVRQVVVNFSGLVEIDSGAFALIRRPTTVGGANTPVSVSVNTATNAGNTVATITFLDQTRAGTSALVDGNYQLTIDATKVRAFGTLNQLDSNQDGTAGDNRVFGANPTDLFFAYFGDSNGDRAVGAPDLAQFRLTLNKNLGQSGYNPNYDFNGDNTVNSTDNTAFMANYGKRLSFN